MAVNDWQKIKTTKKVALGRHVVADPRICHGKLTVRGTRIFVAHVLEDVATNTSFHGISEAWGGKVGRETIVESIHLAREALLTYWPRLEIKDARADDRPRRKHGRKPARPAGQPGNANPPDRR